MPNNLSKFFLLFVGCVLFFRVSLAENYQYYPAQTKVYYQSNPLRLTLPLVGVNNTLYAPLQNLAEALGLEVKFNSAYTTCEIKRPADFLTLSYQLHSSKIKGPAEELSAPIVLIRNTFYVPLADFLWNLGFFSEHSGNNYYIVSRIKEISWQKQILRITGEAPLNGQLQPTATGYSLIFPSCILAAEQKNIFVEDGIVQQITAEQISLAPGKVEIKIQTTQPLSYKIFHEDAESALVLAFDYRPLPPPIFEPTAPAQILKIPNQAPAILTFSNIEPKNILTEPYRVLLSTGSSLFPSRNVLWLPENILAKKSKAKVSLKGTQEVWTPLYSYNQTTYVPFENIFPYLGCTLTKITNGYILEDYQKNVYKLVNGVIVGKNIYEKYTPLTKPVLALPLVQTLKILNYAAYYAQETIFINPRISSAEYIEQKGLRKVLIKANYKLFPRQPIFLDNPPRLVIDFPHSVYDAPLNYLRAHDQNIVMARLAQFEPDTARLVLDLVDKNNSGYLTFEDNGHTVAILFQGGGTPFLATTTLNRYAPVIPIATKIQFIPTAEPKSLMVTLPISIIPEIPTYSPPPFIAHKNNLLQGLKIALIPGHGGTDVGAITRQGLMEKELTLELAKKIKVLLAAKGATPLLCRESDENISLDNQAEFANRHQADLLVSIHFNSFIASAIRGTETYYYKGIDYALARAVHAELLKIPGMRDKGLKKAMMHNLNHTNMPGVLIEPLFLSNPREEQLAKDQLFQNKLALAIVNGLENYLQNKLTKE